MKTSTGETVMISVLSGKIGNQSNKKLGESQEILFPSYSVSCSCLSIGVINLILGLEVTEHLP